MPARKPEPVPCAANLRGASRRFLSRALAVTCPATVRASEQACVCAAVRGRHENSSAQTTTRTPEVHAFPGSRAAALRAEEQATVFSYRFGTRRSTALRQATSVKILAWRQGPAKVALASSIGSGTNSVVSGNSSHSVPASSTARLSTAIGSLRAGDVQAMRRLSNASRRS